MLPMAAAWLLSNRAQGGEDLSGAIVVTPGRRAARRLLEHLVRQTAGRAFVPPTIITPADLPEHLYTAPAPIADDLEATFAWQAALHETPDADLAPLLPVRPDPGDLTGWLDLARQLQSVRDDLAAERVSLHDVPDRAEELLAGEQSQRWRVLADISDRAMHHLEAAGRADRQVARERAIADQRCSTEQAIVLVAVVDLTDQQRAMLTQVDAHVDALVQAPDDLAEGFDAFGAVRSEFWFEHAPTIAPADVRVVDRSRDQAMEVVRTLEHWSNEQPVQPHHVTLGLGEETVAPELQRTLDLASVPARPPQIAVLPDSPPGRLLAAVRDYLQQPRFDLLANLLRHPDLDEVIREALPAPIVGDLASGWLDLLDRYATDHVAGQATLRWLGDPETQRRLKAVHDAAHDILPDHVDRNRPIGEWSQPIADMLSRVYGSRTLRRYHADDTLLLRSLEIIGRSLRDLTEPGDGPLTPRVTCAEAISLLLWRLRSQPIAPEAGGNAIEMLGWLELPLDDAPDLILTSFHEGAIPEAVAVDGLLTDSLRRHLGLMCDHRRVSRDRMLLEAIVRTRQRTQLIACRFGTNDQPLAPSRLMLADDADHLAETIRRFYPEEPEPVAPLVLLEPAANSMFDMPRPAPMDAPLDSLSVTAFRDYLQCPYRFYLRHVLKLETVDDRASELSAMQFGDLAHDVLEAFGRSDLTRSEDPERLVAFFNDTLDARVRDRFGREPAPAVLLQREQLRFRLDTFAYEQARSASEGWRILEEHIEVKVRTDLTVDGEPFTVRGKIDRIDEHPELGYRLLDYKTGDTKKTPDATHRSGRGDHAQWVDLQLPLYRELARDLGIDGAVKLGYIVLPKKVEEIGFELAGWDAEQVNEAIDKAAEVIRAIRSERFWPPVEPAPAYDDFSAVCMVGVLREEGIEP